MWVFAKAVSIVQEKNTRYRATIGVIETLEDGTTAQTGVKDVRKREITVFNL